MIDEDWEDIPDFVVQWFKDAYGENADPADLWDELAGRSWPSVDEGDTDADWQLVHEELASEEKYWNENEVVLRHRASGRYVRFYQYSLPYGIDDYGGNEMEREDGEFEEVFPQEVTTVVFKSKNELRKEKKRKTKK